MRLKKKKKECGETRTSRAIAETEALKNSNTIESRLSDLNRTDR